MHWNKAFNNILAKYTHYAHVFSFDLVIKLPKNIQIHKNIIKVVESKQLFYRPIYALNLIELKTLKTYIMTYLKSGFFWSFKFPAVASILFNKKLGGNLHFCVNYQGLNNLTIKNEYLFLLISKSLNWLGHAKYFTKLDLIGTYY